MSERDLKPNDVVTYNGWNSEMRGNTFRVLHWDGDDGVMLDGGKDKPWVRAHWRHLTRVDGPTGPTPPAHSALSVARTSAISRMATVVNDVNANVALEGSDDHARYLAQQSFARVEDFVARCNVATSSPKPAPIDAPVTIREQYVEGRTAREETCRSYSEVIDLIRAGRTANKMEEALAKAQQKARDDADAIAELTARVRKAERGMR